MEKKQFIALLDELLQRPDVVLDAVQNPDTKWDSESLLDYAIECAHRIPSDGNPIDAESVLRKVGNGVISKSVAVKAMQEYAQQQSQQVREQLLKEIILIVEKEQDETFDNSAFLACENILESIKKKAP